MDLSSYDLSSLGSHAHGHYKAAEKHKEKAEQQYLSAGLYLKEAKQRVLKTRGLTWEKWLKDHCPISRRRADEVIMIADGRTTVEEMRESNRQKQQQSRENRRDVTPDRPEKPNENNERPVQDSQPDPVREAEEINENALEDRIKACKRKLNFATPEQLDQIERILNVRT